VTAEKKVERLLDVPVPVTVLDADRLSENSQNRLQDYFAQIPGLSLTNSGGGFQNLAIRGVTTGVVSNPTVGITIDDVPYGSSTSLGSGNVLVPDIDPSDLERIEVLKGPQGTLYGADSMGGLLKFVTRDPTTDGLSGRMEVLGDYVEQGEPGYGVHGAVNVPLSDSVAFRASGFVRRDPGYIDNLLTDQDNVNRVDVYGGRLSALWRPNDAFSVKLSALLQNTYGDGNQAVDATLDADGNLHPLYGYQKQVRLRGTEEYDLEVRLYTATLSAKIGSLDFISITGYGDNSYLDVSDYTGLYGTPADGRYIAETQKLTQEFRLSSNQGRTLDWLVGAFYTHENSPADLPSYTVDPATGAQTGLLIDYNYPSIVTEYALFGDLTFHITDRFDLQVGGRESENRQVYNETDTGPLVLSYFGFPSPFVNATEHTSGNAFTYLFTPEFKITPDWIAYARFTSGYRLGGNNVNAVVYDLPTQYKPDKTNNYELGAKGTYFGGALTLDASAYYIDWRQIQITLSLPTGRYNANGGDAKSQGLEFSMQTQPAKGLTIAANASVNDAQLTQNLPPTASAFGVSGERLPYSSPFSASLSINQDCPLVRGWVGFIGGMVNYVGSREGEFVQSLSVPRVHFPAYAETDVRGGVRYESWMVNVFLNNVANAHGIVGGGVNYGESPYDAIYIQPRTIGLSLVKRF
jgi:iron complex outermembrane recepter protein